MKFIFSIIILLLGLCGCNSSTKEEKSIIAVSTGPQAWLLSQLLPDSTAAIIQLLPPGANPESFEPAISTMKQLGSASVWMTMDTPGFESALRDRIKANFPELRIEDVSAGISRDLPHFCDNPAHSRQTHGDHEHERSAENSDPHLLSSIRNATVMTGNMAKVLKELYPQDAREISRRDSLLQSRLKILDDSIRNVLNQPERGGSFMIVHPSLGYFARDYGLKQISIENGHKEATPSQIAEAFAAATVNKPRVLFTEKEHPSAGATEIAERSGLKLVEISLNSPDYLQTLRKIAESL